MIKPLLVIIGLVLSIGILITLICLFDYYYVSKRTREDLGDLHSSSSSIYTLMTLEINATSNGSSVYANKTAGSHIDH